MTVHFYAFGSVCRGEADRASDIDLLACIDEPQPELDPAKFSIYTYERIRQLWCDGNPFAWHLHLEARLLFSSDSSDFLAELGVPNKYSNAIADCIKFRRLFTESYQSLVQSSNSSTFHLSCMFLATRNFATCYSFLTGKPIFSRRSPLLIDKSLPISDEAFNVFSRARILSTRGYGPSLLESDIYTAKKVVPTIMAWMNSLSRESGDLT